MTEGDIVCFDIGIIYSSFWPPSSSSLFPRVSHIREPYPSLAETGRLNLELGGPGPNYWSDSPSSVWVGSGGLHLKIRKLGSTWYCAEVISVEPTTYGMHRFYIDGRVDQLDRNVCASPFLYINDNQEIDIEFRSDASRGTNAQYVVQPPPYTENVNIKRFSMNLTGTYSTIILIGRVHIFISKVFTVITRRNRPAAV